MPDDRGGSRRRGVHVSSCWEVFRCLVFRRCFGAVGLHKVGCGRSVSSSRSRRGGDADWYVRVCALETVDARGGSGRDQVYEERLRFAASLCVRLSPSPPRDEGAQGGVLCRRLVYGCAAVATRYAKIVLPTRLMGRTSCSGRVREDVGLWQMGLVVECRGGCARCRDASEGACHNQQADCVGFHVRLHLRHSVGTSRA